MLTIQWKQTSGRKRARKYYADNFWDAKDDLFTDFLILRQTIIAAYYCLENMGFAQEDVNDQSAISSPLS